MNNLVKSKIVNRKSKTICKLFPSLETERSRSFGGLRGGLLVVLFPLWGLGGFAQSVIDFGYCGGEGDSTNLTWVLTTDNVLTIYGNGKMADYTSTISTHPSPWSRYNLQVKTIIVSDNVTTIGNYAFSNFGTTSVTIGNSVITIGTQAFYSCGYLTSVIIPNSVTSIGNFAFYRCLALTSVTIPNSVISIGNSAFENCRELTSVTISDNVILIEVGTFGSCYKLSSVTVGRNVASISRGAFYRCHLSSLSLPNKVIHIGVLAFGECTNMSSVSMGESLNVIEDEAFDNCTSLSTIVSHAVKPPILAGNNVFGNVDATIPVYVQCESVPKYKSDAGWSYFSNYYAIDPPPTPALTVEQQNNAMVITWQNTGAPLYEIYRNNILLKTVSATTYTDTDLEEDKEYCYQIKSIEENCESLLSDTVCQTYKNVGIIPITNEGLRITNTNYELRITNYELQPLNIELFDVMGRNVGTWRAASNETTINISYLQSGMYFIKINNKINKIIIN